MSTIDHKAEAERLIKLSPDISHADPGTAATAHATLYLAEQQRIANLIEVGRDRNENASVALQGGHIINESGEEYSVDEVMDRATEVQILIREGLDLT